MALEIKLDERIAQVELLSENNNLDIKYIDRIGINELGKKQWKELKKDSSSDELLKIL